MSKKCKIPFDFKVSSDRGFFDFKAKKAADFSTAFQNGYFAFTKITLSMHDIPAET